VFRADLPSSVLWRNRQIEAHLILRPKTINHRGDFENQITKPELLVLRPKPGNPPPPWFWGSTKKPTVGFEAKSGETVATSFEAKLEKTVRVVLRPNHSQTIDLGFEAQPRNPRS
jgi:alkanesulfonate monooxygenase SsuD/methylene tetrahydromethanopterin reductase-like flavin-dependent oxidoreductase (luciferase family)